MGREIPHLHIANHALSKGCHGMLLCDRKVRRKALPCARHRARVANDDRADRRRCALAGYAPDAALRATAKRFSPMLLISSPP